MTTITTTREDHRIAWLAALAITLHILEGAFPSPLPGVKPGLANVVTVIVLIRYGWTTAAWVTLLRVLVGSILLGTFLSPTFMLSLAGAVASLALLKAATWLPGRGFGPVGYSVLSALAHMAAQFWVAFTFFIPHQALLYLLPIFMTASVIFGLANGAVAYFALRRLTTEP